MVTTLFFLISAAFCLPTDNGSDVNNRKPLLTSSAIDSRQCLYDRLYTACRTGTVETVEHLLSTPLVDTNVDVLVNLQTGQHRSTLLHVASKAGHVRIVRLLLEHGADPTLRSIV